MAKDDTPALALVFDQKAPRVPGEVITGQVHLYFPTLVADNVEEVHIKLRGSIVTKITRQQGQQQITRRQVVELARETLSLWKKGSAYPPAESHTLVLPFLFELPTHLPPSCSFGGFQWSATVGYAVEVVGERSGLHFNRRILLSFPVLPIDRQGAALRSALTMEGWQGGWKVLEQKDEIRRGIWGDYSQVMATLVMPDIPAFPIHTPIPFTLNIVTITKPMKMDDTKEGETIFPAPPLHPKELEFELNRSISIRAHSWTRSSSDSGIANLGGFGPSMDPRIYAIVQVETADKVWIPSQDSHDEKKHKGQWKQEAMFKSSFTINHPPAFQAQTLGLHYNVKLKVDFPGIGNGLKFEFPLDVVSCMPRLGTQTWDGPPPEIDLPPSYFAAEGWHNDAEKGDAND